MIRVKRMTIENLIIVLFSILPIIDSINGILITKGMPSIGTLYKMFLLGVLVIATIRARRVSKSVVFLSMLASVYIVFVLIINTVFWGGRIISSDFPIKLIFNILTFGLLVNCVCIGYISGISIDRILGNNTWLMIIMILVPYVLGLGNTIYAGGIGYKAFFYSNNELSVALLILFCYGLYKLAIQFSMKNIVRVIGITVCVLLLNTKSGMIACVLGLGLFVVEYLCKKRMKHKGWIITGIVAIIIVGREFVWQQIMSFMERQSYLLSLYGGSFLDTIVSGRTFLLETALNSLKDSKYKNLQVLIGNGFCSNSLVEMDFIDIFFYLGAVGFIAAVVWVICVFIKSINNFKHDKTVIRGFGFLLVIGFSFLAGHTLFMATSGCYFVLLCSYCMTYRREKKEIV